MFSKNSSFVAKPKQSLSLALRLALLLNELVHLQFLDENMCSKASRRSRIAPPSSHLFPPLPTFFFFFFFFQDKSCNLFKFVSVLISASVERVGVSCMRDFFIILFKNLLFKSLAEMRKLEYACWVLHSLPAY